MNRKIPSALEIERARHDEFQALWERGQFGGQRLGQAFYNHFHLHKLSDQSVLQGLYEADGEKAGALIARVFLIR